MRVKTGGMLKGFKYNRKKYWYTDGITETQIFEGDSTPEGFIKGRLKFNKPAWNSGLSKEISPSLQQMSHTKKNRRKERIWINNGIIEKLIIKDFKPLPENFIEGRLPNIKDISIDLNEFITYYETHFLADCYKKFKISSQQLKEIVEKNNLESIEDHYKRLHALTYTEQWRKQHGECLKGKNTWSKGVKHSEEHIRKVKESHSKRTIDDIQKSKLKEYQTRLQTGSYKKHMTKEEKYAQDILLKLFDQNDIQYLYFDKIRYPFECDFYIKSKDLFIEINAYPSHGGKCFDKNNLEDIEKLNIWKYKYEIEGKKQYKNWIYTWTDLDVRKQETAKKSNLNYISLYDINELEEKLNEYL